MAKRKQSKAWWAEIRKKAAKTLAKSREMLKKAEDNYTEICQLMDKYPEDKLDKLDWQEKEQMYARMEVLLKRIEEYELIMQGLDGEYEALRLEVNEYYGNEVMKAMPRKNVFEAMMESLEEEEDEEEGDGADWWKKG